MFGPVFMNAENAKMYHFHLDNSSLIIKIFFIIGILVYLAGCDGYYYLIPIEDEVSSNSSMTMSDIYSDSSNCLSVEVSGGSTQQPFTKKVKAVNLSVSTLVTSDKPFSLFFAKPHIVSGENIIGSSRFSIHFQEAGKRKRRRIEYRKYDIDEPITDISHTFLPGTVWLELLFCNYDGENWEKIEFPIEINLGSIYCESDTTLLYGLRFNATLSLSDSARTRRSKYWDW